MEEKLQLKAITREEKAKKNDHLRSLGMIPAVLYGHGIKNRNLKIVRNDFEKIYKTARESSLVDLIIDGQAPIKVLIHDFQKEEISDQILHVDFYQVRMDEKITTEINLIYFGEAAAVKELGGVLVKNSDTIKVKCYPKDLIKEYRVDIAPLKTFSDYIYAKDIKLPSGLELLTEKDTILTQVMPPRSEEELKSLETEVKEDVEKVEAVEKKAEEAEAEEGEAKEEKKDAPAAKNPAGKEKK